jgi:mannitol/fructose-specific phosphotransferase system IIA component (Ntr-type)
MRISDFLSSANVFPNLHVSDKEEAIRTLSASVAVHTPGTTAESLFQAVMERERIMSTGVGKGLAIPHGKVNGLETSEMAFARLVDPIEYGSIDQAPVSLMFLVVGPESQSSHHIRLLSRISRLMNNDAFRIALLSCTTADQILEHFREEELQMG